MTRRPDHARGAAHAGSRPSAKRRARRSSAPRSARSSRSRRTTRCTLLDADGRARRRQRGRSSSTSARPRNAVRSTIERHGDTHRARRRLPRQRPAQRRRAAPAGRHGAAPDLRRRRARRVGRDVRAHDGRGRHGRRARSRRPPPSATRRRCGFRPCDCSGRVSKQPTCGRSSATTSGSADLVEMDLRGLVAGCHVAAEKFVDVLDADGSRRVRRRASRTIRDLTEAEMRRRIGHR